MERIFDESGQTGTNMFDPEQPYFALGSTNIPEPEAAAIIARTFPGQQGPELKSGNLLRRTTGRRQFLKLAQEVGARADPFCAAKLGKRFVVVSKMVDQVVEPMLSEEGYDFYKDDHARRFANSVGFVVEHLLPPVETLLHLNLRDRVTGFSSISDGRTTAWPERLQVAIFRPRSSFCACAGIAAMRSAIATLPR